jgi:succinate dehydrogenase / fumarate reductase cytochrome b subunit
MSALATASPLTRAVRFYEATNGKKVVMALTGVVLFGYVLAHLLGNLQIYMGPAQINAYAEFLHSKPGALWAARTVLLICVVWHIVAATQLWALNRAARPVSYAKKANVPSSYAARTMKWSGPIIAAFVVFHILHLTTGDVLPAEYQELQVYHNVTMGFSHLPVSIAYIVCMILLCMHLYHGLWSMFQSVGISHPRYTPWLKRFAKVFAIFICVGNISIPISVMLGILPVR